MITTLENRKVTVLKPGSQGPRQTVTQRDLEELLYYERQMKDAAATYRMKRDSIHRCVEMGCEVEPGLRRARLDAHVRDANGQHPRSSTKLVVE